MLIYHILLHPYLGKNRTVQSRLLDERLSMSKRGLRALYKMVIFDLSGTLVNLSSYEEYEQLNGIGRHLLNLIRASKTI